MTALINKDSKAILARLLATENLIVEHKNVSTAAFNPDTRVLTLPIWKEMTGDIYDLLLIHEAAHAIYSPTFDAVPAGMPKSWVNVVEDARIEKLIKRKFPGCAINFFRGYKELFERNFFETKGRELNSYSFIDRINLHFKNVPLVPFSEEEKEYLSLVADCETFDDVIEAVKKIYQYAEEKEEEYEDLDPTSFDETEDGEPVDSQGSQSEESEQEQQGEEERETESFTRSPDESGDEESDEEVESEQDSANETGESETDTAWNRNQESLLDENCFNYSYLTIPDVDLDEMIVSYQEYYAELDKEIAGLAAKLKRLHPWSDFDRIAYSEEKYKEFKNSTTKSVNYLVKEFEMRKSADEYRRSSVAKTGVIDTNMLHTYKWNEDVFKRLTVVPGAKNHGMIFFLDWSGSMDSCIRNTVKQLYNLIWFCNKVQIPFEVYAFSELEQYRHPFGHRNPVDRAPMSIAIHDGIRLHQLFTSKMKNNVLDECMRKFWMLVHNQNYFSNWFHLGGTPLSEAIICSKKISERFLKTYRIQKLNLIYLTDGEANPMNRWVEWPRADHGVTASSLAGFSDYNERYIIRDKSKNYFIHKYDSFLQVETMLEWLKDNINANVIGFRLLDDRDARNFVYNRAHKTWDELNPNWKKDRSLAFKNVAGFDEMYLIKNDKMLGADTKDIVITEPEPTKAQIRKAFGAHMKSKSYNKVILNKFIGAIA